MPDDLPGPRGCTCFRLRRTARRMTRIYDAHLARCGLTLTQYSLLTCLVRVPGPALHELAEMAGMDRTSLTRTLKPMMVRGLVAFAPGPDRRSKRVEATAAGRALRAEAKGLWLAAEADVRARLGVERVTELHAVLDHSFEMLDGLAQDGDRGARPSGATPRGPGGAPPVDAASREAIALPFDAAAMPRAPAPRQATRSGALKQIGGIRASDIREYYRNKN